MITVTLNTELKGGAGSGHHGHAGIPGKQGGSLPGEGGVRVVATESQNNARRAAAWKNDIHNGNIKPGQRKGKAPPKYDSFYDYKSDAGAEDVLNNTHDLRAMGMGGEGTWNNPGAGARPAVKNAIVTQLSEDTEIPYDDVNTTIAQWAYSSNDDDWRSLSLQKAAADEFGLEISEWQQQKIDKFLGPASEAGWTGEGSDLPYWEASGNIPALYPGQQQELLRTMYANTQANFARQGFKATDTITLYRGFNTAKPDGSKSYELTPYLGSEVNWKGNVMESWTSSKKVATNFGINVIAMEVPIRNIIGSCVTGFGCLNEAEYVIAGNTGSKARLIVAGTYKLGEVIPVPVLEGD